MARALREAVPPHRPHRGTVCLAADLVAVALFVASVVLVSFPMMLGGAAVVVMALTMHILWPPANHR